MNTEPTATLSVLPLPDGTYVVVLAGCPYEDRQSFVDLIEQVNAAVAPARVIVTAFPVEVVDVLVASFPEPVR